MTSLGAAIAVAHEEAARSHCLRRKVGAAIVVGNEIVGRGHNYIEGARCDEGGCPRGQLSYSEVPPGSSYQRGSAGYCPAIHAEHAALDNALIHHPGILDAIVRSGLLVTTSPPCGQCQSYLSMMGVKSLLLALADDDEQTWYHLNADGNYTIR